MEYFHLLNRGVDKRDIVTDDFDRFRFIHSLFIFNDKNYVDPNHGRSGYTLPTNERDTLVHIHAYCLMPNHYHMLVSPVDDDMANISLFMKKLNMGYTKYFNERHGRSGYLWQGVYKKIHIEKDAHFMYIPYYIHLNPLDLCIAEWRSGTVKDTSRALTYLQEYKWSSHRDYLGNKNFESVIRKSEIKDMLGSKKSYENEIRNIISNSNFISQSDTLE